MTSLRTVRMRLHGEFRQASDRTLSATINLATLLHPTCQLTGNTADWSRLIQNASTEFILPALAQCVQTLGLASTIAPEIINLLKTTESANCERNHLIVAEATHTASLLNTIGIEPVALKGVAYLLTRVYPNPATRYLQDIDLLIPEAQIPSAVALLTQHGFQTGEHDPLAPLRHHSPTLQRPYSAPVELHHSLGLGICRRLLPAAEILRDALPANVGGAKIRVPSPTHLAIHLILHSQLHNGHRETIFPPLRALYDLQLLTQNLNVDWPSVEKRFRQHGHYLTLAIHLKQAERVLGLTPPIPLKLGIWGNIRWFHRRLLNKFPLIRFADPAYLLPFFLSRRLRIVGQVIRHPEYWTCLLKALFTPDYYRALFRL